MLVAMCAAHASIAQSQAPTPQSAAPASEVSALGAAGWLQRMHAASRQHTYMGTFVVTASSGNLSSARIWHVSEGNMQLERIEALSGPPRSTFRRNDQVMTFLPDAKVVKSEKRENLDLFPSLVGTPDSSVGNLYGVRVVGKDRVAGFDADVVVLEPRDNLRFGYRIWSERNSGLAIKLQTIDGENRVVEQSAFSELQLDAPIKAAALGQMMNETAGYRVLKSEIERTTASREGWMLRSPVAGFKPVSCLRRSIGSHDQSRTVQWTFSDGLASVSLFVEPYDAKLERREGLLAIGATHTLTRRLVRGQGDWWLTAVGEVPVRTLEAFAQSLDRER